MIIRNFIVSLKMNNCKTNIPYSFKVCTSSFDISYYKLVNISTILNNCLFENIKYNI